MNRTTTEHAAWIAQWQDARGEWHSREYATEPEAREKVQSLPANTIQATCRHARIRDVAPRGEIA